MSFAKLKKLPNHHVSSTVISIISYSAIFILKPGFVSVYLMGLG